MSSKSISLGQQSIVGRDLGISLPFRTYAAETITSKVPFVLTLDPHRTPLGSHANRVIARVDQVAERHDHHAAVHARR